jgi:hypothetical protein
LVAGRAGGHRPTLPPAPHDFSDSVQGCKTTFGTGSDSAKTASTARDNVGQCVSTFAKQKGVDERAAHSKASDARTNHPTGKPSDVPSGKPSDLPSGKPSDLPSGKPSDLPSGKPSDLPGGRPTSHPTGKP